MFATIGDYSDADDAGRVHTCSIRKVPAASTITTLGWWADLSMTAGNPRPNYYASAPLVAATLNSFDGIFHGADQPGVHKRLTRLGFISPTAALVCQYRLLDYLLYYPFVDGDDLDIQATDNTVTLPRYADGLGVRVMAVCVATSTGGGSFTFDYIDSDGNPQTSPVNTCSAAAANAASILTSAPASQGGGPFCKLASGSRGIRSITGVTNLTAPGGLYCLVLVKPLAEIAIREISTPIEHGYLDTKFAPPRVYDGAYLNLICNPQGSIASSTLMGWAQFHWSA